MRLVKFPQTNTGNLTHAAMGIVMGADSKEQTWGHKDKMIESHSPAGETFSISTLLEVQALQFVQVFAQPQVTCSWELESVPVFHQVRLKYSFSSETGTTHLSTMLTPGAHARLTLVGPSLATPDGRNTGGLRKPIVITPNNDRPSFSAVVGAPLQCILLTTRTSNLNSSSTSSICLLRTYRCPVPRRHLPKGPKLSGRHLCIIRPMEIESVLPL
jgi:hypothetical protein